MRGDLCASIVRPVAGVRFPYGRVVLPPLLFDPPLSIMPPLPPFWPPPEPLELVQPLADVMTIALRQSAKMTVMMRRFMSLSLCRYCAPSTLR